WFNDTDKELKYTAPSWNPDRKIDYILTSNAQKWDIKDVYIPKPSDRATPESKPYASVSDHLPLLVEMKLTEQ
ncbi:endonuclease/exonuclease/phosphatase family protein, partial [Escherichia coli]